MIYVEVSEMIHAPRDAVFAISTDFPNLAAVLSDSVSVKLVRERYDELTFEVVNKIKKERYTIVQRSLAPEKIVRDVKMRNVSGKVTYTLEPREDGTSITFTMSLCFDGYYRLLSPLIKKELCKRMVNLFLEPLKRAFESGGGSPNEGAKSIAASNLTIATWPSALQVPPS